MKNEKPRDDTPSCATITTGSWGEGSSNRCNCRELVDRVDFAGYFHVLYVPLSKNRILGTLPSYEIVSRISDVSLATLRNVNFKARESSERTTRYYNTRYSRSRSVPRCFRMLRNTRASTYALRITFIPTVHGPPVSGLYPTRSGSMLIVMQNLYVTFRYIVLSMTCPLSAR